MTPLPASLLPGLRELLAHLGVATEPPGGIPQLLTALTAPHMPEHARPEATRCVQLLESILLLDPYSEEQHHVLLEIRELLRAAVDRVWVRCPRCDAVAPVGETTNWLDPHSDVCIPRESR